MSLVQHVSALEGVDFEPDADVEEDFAPIARKISYDVLHPAYAASVVEDAPPATPAYKHSTLKRAGMCSFRGRVPVGGKLLMSSSASGVHNFRVLGGVRHCVRFRCTQTGACGGGRFPRCLLQK